MENILRRAPNFTKTEEDVLMQLVKKYQDIINCKKTDTRSNKIKGAVWIKISKEFRSITGTSAALRDHLTLRRKYENIKKRAKKKIAVLKGIVDGDPANIVLDNNEEIIQSMTMSETQLNGAVSEFDDMSDVSSHEPTMAEENIKSENENIEEATTNYLDENEGSEETNTNNLSPAIDNSNWIKDEEVYENGGTTSSRKRKTEAKWSEEIAKAKINFIEIQMQSFLEEHKLKIEKLKLEKEILKYELEYKKKLADN